MKKINLLGASCLVVLLALLWIAPSVMASDSKPPAAPPAGTPQMDKDTWFKKLDQNHDGKLSREEHAKPWQDKKAANQYFDQLDRDQSGFVTKDEFMPPPATVKIFSF